MRLRRVDFEPRAEADTSLRPLSVLLKQGEVTACGLALTDGNSFPGTQHFHATGRDLD